MKTEPAYTRHARRLQDVISAIQVLANYETTTASAERWQERIGAAPVSADHWGDVFRDHPEFFRVYDVEDEDERPTKHASFSLVLRRSQQRLWLRKERRLATPEELPHASRGNLTWQPLGSDSITALVDVAVKLQAAEWAHTEKTRWWLPVIIPASAGLLGVILGALLKG
jgi:hypothetical protein